MGEIRGKGQGRLGRRGNVPTARTEPVLLNLGVMCRRWTVKQCLFTAQ